MSAIRGASPCAGRRRRTLSVCWGRPGPALSALCGIFHWYTACKSSNWACRWWPSWGTATWFSAPTPHPSETRYSRPIWCAFFCPDAWSPSYGCRTLTWRWGRTFNWNVGPRHISTVITCHCSRNRRGIRIHSFTISSISCANTCTIYLIEV